RAAAAELVGPDRGAGGAAIGGCGGRGAAAAARRLATARRDVDAERRALDRLEPRARLAGLRERAGLLLDRAARAVGDRLAGDGRRLEALRVRAPGVVGARLASTAGGLAAASASLAALGPQATLERGYAIVRRAGDGAILRDPSAAPAGTFLIVALAAGSLAATSEGPARLPEGDPA
ncbi:MAG: exodeoxyribonuclease VII large subunit, partial [Candidatus Limnocylindrales bacterium]